MQLVFSVIIEQCYLSSSKDDHRHLCYVLKKVIIAKNADLGWISLNLRIGFFALKHLA